LIYRAVVSPTTLEVENLAKAYGGVPLFSGLTFLVETGLTAVQGRNGSGKTTLVKILSSLLRPSAGEVRLRRGDRELAGDEKRLAIGWAGLDLAFYEDFSARENLAFFRRAAGQAASSEEIDALLAGVGLEQSADQRVGAFSTGMKQRLRIAFALLFDPPILVLDEPMAGLDAEGRQIVQAVVGQRRRSGAVVLASNDERDFVEPEQVVALGR
jgi:ABC-type multidrug transport system ATPase subunit